MSSSPEPVRAPEDVHDDAPPSARTDEQEIAAGRSAATPFAAILGVWIVIAAVVALVLALVLLVLLLR